jgi:exopolysaccharide production protein ExoZ
VKPAVGQLQSIQALRAVAALSVFFFHYAETLRIEFGFPPGLFSIGDAGVDIFFVISGFIMCLTTDRPDQRSPGQFAVKRLARILPLYYVMTLGVFALALVAPHLLGSTTASLGNLVKSLLFVPYAREDGMVQPILFLGWTLNYEMFFYAIFTLALLTGRPAIAAIGVIVALVVAGAFIPDGNVVVDFYTSGILLEFVFGCLLYLAFRHRPHWLKAVSLLWVVGVLALAAQNFYPQDLPREIGRGLPALLIVGGLLGSEARAGGVIQSALARLGDASYSLYLGHPYVIALTTKVAVAVFGASLVSAALVGVASLAVTIVASLLMFALLERPSNEWLRRILLGERPRSSQARSAG